MGHTYGGIYAYDKNNNRYDMTGIELEDFNVMNVSLWYEDIVNEIGRCRGVVTTGVQTKVGNRVIGMHDEILSETYYGKNEKIVVNPLAGRVVIDDLSSLKDIYIGYCYSISLEQMTYEPSESRIRLHFNNFYNISISLTGIVELSLEEIKKYRQDGSTFIAHCRTLVKEFEEDRYISSNDMKSVYIDKLVTYRENVDMCNLLMLAVGTSISRFDNSKESSVAMNGTKTLYNLGMYFTEVSEILIRGEEPPLFAIGSSDIDSLLCSFYDCLSLVMEVKAGVESRDDGYYYQGIRFTTVMTIFCRGGSSVRSYIYKYNDTYILLLGQGKFVTVCCQIKYY